MSGSDKEDQLSDSEIAKRRDAILKRMHKMPPKPHKDIKGESSKKATGKREKKKRLDQSLYCS